MEQFTKLLLSRPWVVLVLTALLATAGWFAWTRLPIDAFPDVTNVQVMILTEAPGLSSVDVEQQVTYPIEQQMGGVPKVTQVRSLSKAGLSQVIVVFEDNTDIYFARQQVFERLTIAREHLPAFAEPGLGPISTGLGEIFQYTLEGKGLTAMELRRLQDAVVSPQLRPIPGVNEVNSFFLAELRTALIVVFSLPLTFLITFLIMGWAGISSNLMSLGGLAFSVGMVVDAAIVIVENMRRHFAEQPETHP